MRALLLASGLALAAPGLAPDGGVRVGGRVRLRCALGWFDGEARLAGAGGWWTAATPAR